MKFRESRSCEKITVTDLNQLLRLAQNERKLFFKHNPKYKPYYKSLLAIVLCQGAAKHFVDGKTGIKDFDIWFFYKPRNSNYPLWRLGRYGHVVDSGIEKFGKNKKHPEFVGRKVDMMIRELPEELIRECRGNPRDCIKTYLEKPMTQSARKLSEKAAVGLFPKQIFRKILYKSKKLRKL